MYEMKDYTSAQQAEIRRIIAWGGVYDFDGKNCDDCSGWDGISHRCNCGNRRMSWGVSVGAAGEYVYAEAY